MAITLPNTALTHSRVRSLVTADAFDREADSRCNLARVSLATCSAYASLQTFGFVNVKTLCDMAEITSIEIRSNENEICNNTRTI